MIRRPAVTLMEVLIAMFIMAIGMLALLALFPVGAASMAQALKDDRCAATAAMADNVAVVIPATNPANPAALFGIRQDLNVTLALAASNLVYVDPYGKQGALGSLGGVIPRVSPSSVTTPASADRWFSLPDDVTYLQNGIPDVPPGGFVDRGRRYSFAFLLRKLPSPTSSLIQLYVVVYAGRPVNSLATAATEVPLPYLTAGTKGSNSITVTALGLPLKRGGWILDPISGTFYRVTNFAENLLLGTTTVEVQQNLVYDVASPITVMDTVAEVFDRGTGWRP